jgi:hypothetical protein
MGSSFVDYRGRGFWSHDAYIERFLGLLASAATSLPDEVWLHEAGEHWRLQASGVFNGWVHPLFDDYLSNDQRRLVVLALVSDVRERAGSERELKQTCELVQKLLMGDLTTDASSPLDYMVQPTREQSDWS